MIQFLTLALGGMFSGAAHAGTQVTHQRGNYVDVGGILSMDDCSMESFHFNSYAYSTSVAGGDETEYTYTSIYVYGYDWCTGEAHYGYAENPTGITVSQRGSRVTFAGAATLVDYYGGASTAVTLDLTVDATDISTGMYNYSYDMGGSTSHYHGRGTYRSGTPTGTVNGAEMFYGYATVSSDASGTMIRSQ